MKDNLKEFLEEKVSILESKRKKLKFLQKLFSFTIKPLRSLSCFVGIVSILITFLFPPALLWFGICAVVYIGLSFVSMPYRSYNHYVKNGILPKVFAEIDDSYQYHPYGLNECALRNSGFFQKSFFSNHTDLIGNDYVKGTIEGVDVEFNEVKFYREEINYIKSFGWFILSLFLIPIMLILSIVTDSGGDGNTDIPFFEFVREEVMYYKGLFMHAELSQRF